MPSLKTRFTEQVGIKYPIICGAMYPCSSPNLVASVSLAGGLGIVQPMSFITTRGLDLRQAFRDMKKITTNPVGMNIILVPGYENRLRAWMDIALEEGCRFFVTALGKPTWVVEKAHAVGGLVYHDTIKVEHALKGIDAGVDGLICVNNQAGGHAGYQSPQELYDQLKDFHIPLICAGSVGNEDDFIRALDMGYDGVQMATRFIATHECDESDAYKQAILKAKASDIIMTAAGDGIPGAIIKPENFKETEIPQPGFIMKWLLQNRRTKKYARMWMARIFANQKGPSHQNLFSAGKSVEHIDHIEHVSDIIQRFVSAAKK
ncbi:MAG: nitronate monooxygenase [Alphaproteobacteria bacterium]|nr:nitronate monooxygenase [Alphaproteobacteria bacterium]